MIDDAAYNANGPRAPEPCVRQPEPDLDREPAARRDRDDHVLRHRQEPRHRERDPGRHGHVATAGSNCPAAGTDSRCTTTVTVSGLTIASTTDVSSTAPGGTVHYTVTVTNSGQTAFTGATFTDSLSGVLDDATYNGNAAATTGTVSFASPNLTWTGNLAVGATPQSLTR